MKLREIERADIKDILDIRVSTKENHFSMTDLAEVGVGVSTGRAVYCGSPS